MRRHANGKRAQRIAQSVAIFCSVWEDIKDRIDDVSRKRICHVIADAILDKVRTGARDPADIYAHAVSKACRSLN